MSCTQALSSSYYYPTTHCEKFWSLVALAAAAAVVVDHCGFWAFLQKLENSTLTFVHFFSCLCNVGFLVFWAMAIVGLWRRRRKKKKKSKKRRRWICADLLMTSCRESCVITGSFKKLHIKICIYILYVELASFLCLKTHGVSEN